MRKDGEELGLHRPDELFGPARDSFPTTRPSNLAPGEFSPLNLLGTDRLALNKILIKPEISDNGDSPE